jgi:lupus La protein
MWIYIYDPGNLLQYYFGDINLPRDKFLQEQIKLEDGWIPLEVMLKFKRLASLTTDPDVIVTALEASEVMEVRTCTVV